MEQRISGLQEFLDEYGMDRSELEAWTNKSSEYFERMSFWDIRNEVFADTLAVLERSYHHA